MAAQLVASRVVLGSTELVSLLGEEYGLWVWRKGVLDLSA
jgi:hypothetical protein